MRLRRPACVPRQLWGLPAEKQTICFLLFPPKPHLGDQPGWDPGEAAPWSHWAQGQGRTEQRWGNTTSLRGWANFKVPDSCFSATERRWERQIHATGLRHGAALQRRQLPPPTPGRPFQQGCQFSPERRSWLCHCPDFPEAQPQAPGKHWCWVSSDGEHLLWYWCVYGYYTQDKQVRQTVLRNCHTGTSLVVQGLRLHAPNAGGLSSIPGQGTRSHMPY